VRNWVDFASSNDGTLPEFSLPLGDPNTPCGGDLLVTQLMNAEQTAAFENACIAAGSRFVAESSPPRPSRSTG